MRMVIFMKKTYLRWPRGEFNAQDLASTWSAHIARSIPRNCLQRAGRDSPRRASEGKTVRSAELLRRGRFVAVAGTSEITLTREVDKAQSFVHDKTRSPVESAWSVVVLERRRLSRTLVAGNVCTGAAMIYPQTWRNTVGRGGGGRAPVEKIYATCSRAGQKTTSAYTGARARAQKRAQFPAICMKFHRLSPSSVFMLESTESELSASPGSDIMPH